MKNNTETHSAGEIAFYVTRAALGKGIPYGIAEDFANSLIWTQRAGIDLAQLALNSLESLESNPGSDQISLCHKDLTQVFTGQSGLSAVFAGPSLSDFWQILVKHNDSTLIAKEVDYPILVAGAFAGAAARPAILEWPNACIILSANGDTDIIITDEMALKNVGRSDILIRNPGEKQNAIKSRHINTHELNQIALQAINEGIYVDKKAWTSIVNLFNRSLVPSNNQSLNRGAGAGLVDTD